MPIALAPLHEEVTVVRIGCDPKDLSHLAALGLSKGAVVTVISSVLGSVVVLVKGTRLALDHQIAAKIFVA
ncbi:MAG: ferrous iron transport protein A [Bacilli bacterium]|nr:ferrous iron transport protein A [Bacilli bacterium]